MGVVVREMKADEWREWSSMRATLFETSFEDARVDCEQFIAGEHRDLKVVFVGVHDSQVIAFAEISERSYVDGCYAGPVAFVEGWSVQQDFQGQGVGRKLVEAAVGWARKHNYPHLASNVALDNLNSHKAHVAVGFEEVDRVVQYRMTLREAVGET